MENNISFIIGLLFVSSPCSRDDMYDTEERVCVRI